MKITKKRVLTTGLLIATLLVLMSIGCAPRMASSGNEADSAITGDTTGDVDVTFNWTSESDCATCHSTEEGSLADATTTAGVHQTSLLNCIQCHTDTDSKLAQAHEKVEIGQSTARSLKRTFVASEACTASGCHDDPAPRITATAELETFNDGKTTVVNPHELPDVKDHGTVTCSSCHKGHTAMEMDKLILVCRSCHHTGSFECGTCH